MNFVSFVVFLLSMFSTIQSFPFYSKRELAPSLTLDRIKALKDSIDQLNDIRKQMRCQEKAQELAGNRNKRMLSPSLRLSELIDPLVSQQFSGNFNKRMISPSLRLSELIDPLVVQESKNGIETTTEDPCVAFYNDVPYYF